MAKQQATAIAERMNARTLPHNLDLEKTILASLLMGQDSIAIHKVRQFVTHPLAFFTRDHRIIYLACLDVDDNGDRVDSTGVAEWLSKLNFRVVLDRLQKQQLLMDAQGANTLSPQQMRSLYTYRKEDDAADFGDSALAAIGGYAALMGLAEVFAPSSALERNASLLWDYHLKRRFIQGLTLLSEKAYQTTGNFNSLIDEGSQTLLDLSRMGATTGIEDAGSVIDQTIDKIGEAINNPNTGVKTGYDELDHCLMSLRPGGLYILAARPGAGKTSFALNVVENIVSSGDQGVLFFSLEVEATDLMKKILSARSRVPFEKLETGGIDEGEMDAIMEASKEIRRWSLDLMDIADLTIHQLRSHAKRHQLERKGLMKCIFIDYLQLLSASKGMNEFEKVSEISRTLKILAKDLKLPIVALSQLSREGDKTTGKPREPRLSDLRGSGSIEQDADAVIFLHRVDPDEDTPESRDMKVIVAKNRFGPQASVNMNFQPARQKFVSVPKEAEMGDVADVVRRSDGFVAMNNDDEDDEDVFG